MDKEIEVEILEIVHVHICFGSTKVPFSEVLGGIIFILRYYLHSETETKSTDEDSEVISQV